MRNQHVDFATLVHAARQIVIIRESPAIWFEFLETVWQRVSDGRSECRRQSHNFGLRHCDEIEALERFFRVSRFKAESAIAAATCPSETSIILCTIDEFAEFARGRR